MAKQKHVAPLEDSDHEEEEDSSEGEDEVASSNEDEDTDEGEDERDKHMLVPRKPQLQTVSKPSSSSSEVESDSEPEPEPEPEPESLLENAKASSKLKSQPSSSVSDAKSGSKRAAKNSIDPSNQPKRGKKAQDDDAAGSDEVDPNKSRDESKSIFEGKRMSELCGTSLALTSMLRYDGTFGEPYGEGYIRKGIELLGVSKREEIEARWKKFEDAEKKLHVEIAEFYAEQAQLIYQVNSSLSS
ncbi:uncharacterized protein LOC130955504 isoform X2 [Arachis stenosperma]|uniref:uncharacterized protein LOC130955504 isoform X2 n=1 Tax=Arachis stenosperma TaxID=217475 RepID=UPI0025AD8F77|nr:uncharacterized protein LOC130955504 isoform X2 [Arachis stenosperma]